MILLKLSILIIGLIAFIFYNASEIKKGNHIPHGTHAFVVVFFGLLVLVPNEPSNLKLFSYMFLYLSWWWLLFDLGLNLKRGLPLNYIGRSAKLDKLLKSIKVNQFIIKGLLILISTFLFLSVCK
jgi:hypothetical protein